MIFFFAGLIGILIMLIILLIRIKKDKKLFTILTISILIISITSVCIGIKFIVSTLNRNDAVATIPKKIVSIPKDITETDVNTLVEPKTEEEKALAYGYYKYSNALLQKLKKEQNKAYPQFGELKNQITMRGSLFVIYGSNKSVVKNQKYVFEDPNSNSLYKYPDNVFGYTAKTLFDFDDDNKCISALTRFDFTSNYADEFKTVRDKLIKYHGKPTFQNVFLTPKDKFDESKDKNITYIIRWESEKKSVILMYEKKEKDIQNSRLSLDYTLKQ